MFKAPDKLSQTKDDPDLYISTKEFGSPESYDPSFRGPIEKRSCTDILCLLIFIVFLVGWGVIAGFAVAHGDPSRLLRPTDSRGQVCGRDELVKDKPFLYFFDLTRCAAASTVLLGCPTPQVCVEKCPNETWFYNPANIQREKLICNYDVDPSKGDVTDLITKGLCSPYYIESKEMTGRCIPKIFSLETILDSNGNVLSEEVKGSDLVKASEYIAKFYRAQEVAEGVFQDIRHVWHIVLIGCFISMAISLLWIILLRFISGFMIWFSLFAFTGLSGYCAYYTMDKYLTLRDKQQEQIANMSLTTGKFSSEFSKFTELETTWLVLFIITVLIFLICLIVIIFLRKRVRIAISLIGHSSKAVGGMMSSLFFPILPYLLQLSFLALFVGITVLLTSAGSPQYQVMCADDCSSCTNIMVNDTCTVNTFNNTDCPAASCQFFTYYVEPFIPYLHIYNVFGIFWILFFISAMGEMALAGAFSTWYWTFNKSDVPTFSLLRSLKWTMVYHVGTLAFGSLIIAIVRITRVFLEYIDRKVKEQTDNGIIKGMLCCCKCCLWCLEKFLKFVNRNAYIYCAIYSKNFCSSAKNAFNLIMRNILRVVILDKVTDFLLLIGKLVITGGVGLATFFVFSKEIPVFSVQLPAMNYYLTPVILITIATYFIASAFFSVYEMAVDTIFICFLEDCERNDGTPEKPYYMSKDLMKILKKENEFTSEEKEKDE